MVLSIKTQTFQDTLKEIKETEGDEARQQVLKDRGIDEQEFMSAYNEEYIPLYNKTSKELFKDKDTDSLSSEDQELFLDTLDKELTIGGDTDFDIGRFTARNIGKAASGTVELVDALADTTETGKKVTDFISEKIDEYVPDVVEEYFTEVFDPYAGRNSNEPLSSDISSLFIGGGLLFKAAKTALKSSAIPAVAARSFINKAKRKGISTIGKTPTKIATAAIAGGAAGVTYTLGEPFLNDVREVLKNNNVDTKGMDRQQMLSEYYSKVAPKNLAIDSALGAASLGIVPIIKGVSKTYKGTKLDRFVKETFTSQRGVDDNTFSAAIKRDAASAKALLETEGLNSEFKKAIKQNTTLNKMNKSELDDFLNKALEGDTNATQLLNNVSPEVQNIISKMRNKIDTISSNVSNNLVGNSELKATIDSNLGTYVNVSYDVFDDPIFRNEMVKRVKKFKGSDKVVQNAANYIKSNVSSVNDNEAKRILLAMLRDSPEDQVKKELGSLSKLFTTGPSGVFRPKEKNMPKELKEFFGEVKDSSTRYSKTIEKLSRISSEMDFIKDLEGNLISRGLAKSGKVADPSSWQDASELIKGRLERVMGREAAGEIDFNTVAGKLDGLYLDPTYAKIMREGLTDWTDTANSTLGKYFGTFLKLKGASQAAKTIYNPETHVANILGQGAILFANGMLPIGKTAGKAATTTFKSLTGMNSEKLGNYLGRARELGVVNSNVTTGMIRRNLQAAGKSPIGWMDKIGLRRVKNAGKKVNDTILDVYQAEDDVFKLMHFEKTKNYLKKAYPDLTEDKIEVLASQRTRDLMPNYSQVSKAISGMRSLPFGDFLSFPAEMIRTSKNLAKYTLRDAVSGNTVLQKEAAKKLAGMTTVGFIPGMAMEYSKQSHGITNDQEDSINSVAPNYEAFSNRIYMSGINTDKNKHKGVNYLRLGSLDPYDYLKSMAAATHQVINTIGLGLDDEDNLSVDIANRPEFNKAAMSLLENQMAPFLGTSMITDAVIKLFNGKSVGESFVPSSDYIGSSLTNVGVPGLLANTLSIALDPFTPGFMNFYKKKQESEQGQGMKVKSRATINPSEVNLQGLLGFGKKRFDLTAGLNYQLQPLEGKFKGAGKKVSKEIENLSSSPDAIYKAYLSANKDRFKSQEELKAVMEAYRKLGFSNNDISSALAIKKGQASQLNRLNLLTTTENNKFIPLQLSNTDYTMSFNNKNRQLPKQIQTLYDSLLDTNITPENTPLTLDIPKPRDVYDDIFSSE
tara:strand:- start:4866 stop:8624 length:3759 start_codon:yes stop_codon:yes gene_type:complete